MDREQVELARQQAKICNVFSNANRILILWFLEEQGKSVSEIAEAVNISVQNTSQHLGLMKKRGILECYRKGQKVYYQICDNVSMDKCILSNQSNQILKEKCDDIRS
ncbi:MAG: metalloregulator ArsR/SmtB family transcription factor [Anaerolineales bacterium]|jgi:DNA-binding transcriptional ArsR family regulator